MPGQVIVASRWLHKSGKSASVHGAVPWKNAHEAADWKMQDVGFSIQHPDGTVGLGRAPFATREEAQAWVDKNPNFRGMGGY